MDKNVPAWLICENLLVDIKNELVLEAIDVLHQEIKEGRIGVNGGLVTASEGKEEIEKDLFIINKIIESRDDTTKKFMEYIREKESDSSELDEYTVKRIEDMKRFLIAVGKISYLMELSVVFNVWVDDAGREARTTDPVEILERTMLEKAERLAALEFVLGRKFRIDDAISENEKEILEKALSKVRNVQ
jgi:uncharacterized membrane protein